MKKILFIIIAILVLFQRVSYAEFPAVEVYQKTSGSVVMITAKDSGRGSMVGAGSLISRSGMILTNAHVVIDSRKLTPYENIKVYFKPERVTGDLKRDLTKGLQARVKAFDNDLDLAIITVKEVPRDIKIMVFSNPEEIRIGEEVVAIGHPERGGLWTLTYGRISGEIHDLSDIKGKNVFQTDTSLNRGNSGGPLLDRRGYMTAINSSIARLGAGNMPITGVNFAIKSSVVKQWLEKQNVSIEYGNRPLYEHAAVKAGNESTESAAAKTSTTRPATGQMPEDKVMTPKRPYKFDVLFEEVEKDMEDLMLEMRGKVKKR